MGMFGKMTSKRSSAGDGGPAAAPSATVVDAVVVDAVVVPPAAAEPQVTLPSPEQTTATAGGKSGVCERLQQAFATCLGPSQPSPIRQPSSGVLMQAANTRLPPGRVRHLFKILDKDASSGLSMDELTSGFCKELQVTALAPHVIAKMQESFDKAATADAGGAKSLKANVFSRFYCEVLFRHFDKNNDNFLQLAEVEAALAFLSKTMQNDANAKLVVAYPPEFTTASGEVHLPVQWFWTTFSAME